MIHLVIMASGFSRRMGQDKLLVDLQGKTVIQWVIEAARQTGIESITVVYRDPRVSDIAEACGVSALYNPWAFLGQSAGIRLAVEMLPSAEGYLFLAGDQPLISKESLLHVIETHRKTKAQIVSAAWQGNRTLPALFSRSLARHLLSLDGDQGGRSLIECGLYTVAYQELCGVEEQWDVDTAEALKRIKKWLDARAGTGSCHDEQTR